MVPFERRGLVLPLSCSVNFCFTSPISSFGVVSPGSPAHRKKRGHVLPEWSHHAPDPGQVIPRYTVPQAAV